MKCSKCGEECRDNQAFCLKCGNPIQVVPDFNLIEAELANNIGVLLEEEIADETYNEYTDVSNMETKKIDSNLEKELKTLETNKKEERVVISGNRIVNSDKVTESASPIERRMIVSRRNKKKQRIIIMSVITLVVLLAVIGASMFAISKFSERNEYNKATFDSSYNKAVEYMLDGDYENAIKQTEIAIDKATNVNEKVKARLYLDQIYEKVSGSEEKKIANLLEITKLCPSESSYFKRVAQYYLEKKQYEKLSAFVNSIENEDVFAALSEYTVDVPKSSVADGTFAEYFSVELTAEEGCKIYYRIYEVFNISDDIGSAQSSTEEAVYSEPIAFDKEGSYVVRAYAVNELGVLSKVGEFRYVISLSIPNAPVITPTTGEFTEYSKITITVPEGAVVYYTIDDVSISTESNVYVEPIDMLVGVHIIRAIVVDKYGMQSEVAEESYTFKPKENYSPAEAKELLEKTLIEDGVILEDTKLTEDGYEVKLTYKETKNYIGNAGYYIFTVTIYDENSEVFGEMLYGFDYHKGEGVKVDEVDGEYKIVDPAAGNGEDSVVG